MLRSAGALVDACFLSKFDRTGIRLAGDDEDDDGVVQTDALGEFNGAIVIGLQGVVHAIIVCGHACNVSCGRSIVFFFSFIFWCNRRKKMV